GLRRKDLLGEMLRGVGLRSAESRPGRRSGGVRTFGAELGGRGEGPTALGAHPGQRRSALLAELRARLVLVLAPGAVHRPDLPNRGPTLPRAGPGRQTGSYAAEVTLTVGSPDRFRAASGVRTRRRRA